MAFFGGISLPTQLTLSYGVGRAAGAVLEPQLQGLVNSSWELITNEGVFVPPDPVVLASGVAQGQIDPATATLWASYRGLGSKQFQALVDIANVGPGSAYAFELWRRGVVGEDGFRRAVKRLGWEQEWIDDAVQIKDVLLSPEALAVMIQRSVVPNPGILPNQPPTDNSDVPPMPVVDIDVVAEAAGSGTTLARLEAMARIIGLPASPDLAARMHFRKIINEHAFNQAIKEGNTRGEWAPFLLDGFREIPTAEQFVEAHLRGWITKQDMYDGTALHGMSQPDTDLEFRIHRRPLTPRQITQAEAWGGSFQPEAGEIQDPYVASVHQANLGPEWYDLAESLKYTYSVPFWWRSMAQSGDLGPQEAETILLRLGNPPAFAKTTTQHFAGTATAATDPYVTKAQNQLWTTTHRSYVGEMVDAAAATTALEAVGVPAGTAPAVLNLWNEERALIRKQLTPAQVKKAYKDGLYTQQQATDALLARGYDQTDATTLLEE